MCEVRESHVLRICQARNNYHHHADDSSSERAEQQEARAHRNDRSCADPESDARVARHGGGEVDGKTPREPVRICFWCYDESDVAMRQNARRSGSLSRPASSVESRSLQRLRS
eukprot:758918-Hanusia_phi.AAC.2